MSNFWYAGIVSWYNHQRVLPPLILPPALCFWEFFADSRSISLLGDVPTDSWGKQNSKGCCRWKKDNNAPRLISANTCAALFLSPSDNPSHLPWGRTPHEPFLCAVIKQIVSKLAVRGFDSKSTGDVGGIVTRCKQAQGPVLTASVRLHEESPPLSKASYVRIGTSRSQCKGASGTKPVTRATRGSGDVARANWRRDRHWCPCPIENGQIFAGILLEH